MINFVNKKPVLSTGLRDYNHLRKGISDCVGFYLNSTI